jgi:hypothetical protein
MKLVILILVTVFFSKAAFAQDEVVLDCMLRMPSTDRHKLQRETIIVDREKRTVRLKGALYTLDGTFYDGYIRKIAYWGSDAIGWTIYKPNSMEVVTGWRIYRMDGTVTGDNAHCKRVPVNKKLF